MKFTARDLQALQAPNPEYNTTIADALTFTAAVWNIGFHAVKIVALPISGMGAANAVQLEDLVQAGVAQDVALNISVLFDGTIAFHNLGLMRRIFANYDALSAYSQVFADLFGPADNFGRSPLNRLLESPPIKEAVVNAIAAAVTPPPTSKAAKTKTATA